jgi:hypothetical protein
MKTLLSVTALLELGAGLAVLIFPEVFVDLLLRSTLDGIAALTVARIAGAALTALAVACWLARNDPASAAARELTLAMVLYNLGAVLVLGYAGVQSQVVGILLWPAVIIHVVMTVWCVLAVIRRPV